MAAVNNTTGIVQEPGAVPGEGKSLKKRLLEVGSEAVRMRSFDFLKWCPIQSSQIQSFAPVNQIKTHLCGFAFYANDPSRQVPLAKNFEKLVIE